MILKTSQFEFNLTTNSLTHKGVAISLRPKTLELLRYLLVNRDRIISHEELLDEIWSNVVVQEQIIAQSLHEIRKLFGDRSCVKTYKKRGYQWNLSTGIQDEIVFKNTIEGRNGLIRKVFPFAATFAVGLFLTPLYSVDLATPNIDSNHQLKSDIARESNNLKAANEEGLLALSTASLGQSKFAVAEAMHSLGLTKIQQGSTQSGKSLLNSAVALYVQANAEHCVEQVVTSEEWLNSNSNSHI